MAKVLKTVKIVGFLSATLALAACESESAYFETVNQREEPTVASAVARCDASALQNFIGQPRSAVERANLDGPVRFIGPGEFVTESNDPSRSNFLYNADNVVTSVRCG